MIIDRLLDKKDIEKIVGDIKFCTLSNCARVRALSSGWNWYCWRGANICGIHKHLKNVFVRWDTPPSIELLRDGSPVPHHAGSQWGCKCYAEPIIQLEGIFKPPYRVCLGNEIVRMNKRDFLKKYQKDFPK